MVACVLASGAGLLTFGVVSLWRAAQDAEARALQAANAQAQRAVRELRERFAAPGTVAADAWQFVVESGELVVPHGVLWLDVPPDLDELLPPSVWAARRDARAAEFVAREPARAMAELRAALAATSDALGQQALRIALAFVAQRCGDAAALDSLWSDLVAVPTPPHAFAAEVLLLAASVGRPLPPHALAALPTLDPQRARAVVARLSELIPQFAAAPHLAALTQTTARRERLLAARALLPDLLTAATLQQRARGAELVLWWPAGSGSGRGLLGPAAELCALFGGDSWREAQLDVVHGEPLPDGAVPIVAGLGAVFSRPASAAARPVGLTVLLATLALVFAVGLAFTLAALRREAVANAARGEFLVSVTHELKTPIAAMRLLAEMLDEDRVRSDAQRRDYYRMLAGESVRLQALVDNVLDLGRLERGERALDLRPCALGDVVRHAVEVFAPVAARDGRDVKLRGDDLIASVCADRMALTQALLNVLDNARKYAPQGPLEVELRLAGDRALVCVRDHGPGVPSDERERIFERFVRGARQRSGSVPGVGLGLYLARGIVTAHGGTLACESPDGPGALFCFAFPLLNSHQVATP